MLNLFQHLPEIRDLYFKIFPVCKPKIEPCGWENLKIQKSQKKYETAVGGGRIRKIFGMLKHSRFFVGERHRKAVS